MTAVPILADLRRQGVTVRREGDRLKLTAATVIPADLLERARAEKAAILAALPDPTEQRTRLLLAAQREGIDRDVIDCLDDAELEGVEHWNDTQLRTAVRWYRDDPPSLWRAALISADNRKPTP
jgi:hypothetical protein